MGTGGDRAEHVGTVAGWITQQNLHELLRYHPPTPPQTETYQQMRRAGYDFCKAILALTPECEDQQRALQKAREALFLANAAIALEGKL